LGRTEEVFAQLLGAQQSSEMQRTALRSLSRYTDDAVAPLILERWNMFTPRLRRAAGDLLLSRRNWTAALLDAMEGGDVRPGDLDPAQRQLLLSTSDASLKMRAKKLLTTQSATGQELVRKYRQALTIEGSAPAGLEVFRRTCAACHRAGKVGHNIGPDLATLQNRGNESILVNVLDPNREVNPRYINYVVITDDGRTTTGMLENESATSLTLRRAEAESEIILRNQIDEIRATGLSLMPEGMDKQIDIQQMADLLAYIQTIK